MYCWWGNELIFESQAVSQAALDVYHTENSQHSSKALILIMLRAQRPLYVTAGKLVPLSYESFVAVSILFYLNLKKNSLFGYFINLFIAIQ